MRLRRNKGTIQVEFAFLPTDLPEYFVSLKALEDIRKRSHETLIETRGDFHVITTDAIYSYVKPNGKPRILKANKVEIHPDHSAAMVHLSKEALFQMANTNRVTVMETVDAFVIPASVTFIAEKQAGEK